MKLELHECKSGMQTLKVHAILFKKGYWTKEGIYYYYCWFGVFEQQQVKQQQLGLKTASSANKGFDSEIYLP